jgi:hypothetical protein
MMVPEPAMEFMERLDAVEKRLERLAGLPAASGLTEPEEPSGERWDWGQVWAHLAEFPAYWIEQIRHVLAGPPDEAPPFGRAKTDPIRVGAIEADRGTPPPELWQRVQGQLDDLRTLLQEMTPEDWDRRVTHSTLGIMGMRKVFEPFLVGHLEEHAAQLEGLAATS